MNKEDCWYISRKTPHLPYGEKTVEKNHIKPATSQGYIQDVVPGTPATFEPIYVEIQIQGAECRDRRDI